MADLGQIDVRIGADTKRLEQGLQKSKGELKEFEGKVSTGAAKMALFTGAAIAGAAALRGLGQFIASSVRLSADLAETQSKFNTVFDASSAKVDKLASSFGILSKGEAQGFLATTGAILRGAGLAGEQVEDLAVQVGELARDFSSFNNVPVAETFNAINAAITGEREQLKRLGIVINEADVQQRALADSGKKAASELTKQEKATATLALITTQAKVQVGDYVKTQNSAANQAKQFQTQIQNLGEAFAEGLEPAVRMTVAALNDVANADLLEKTFTDLGTTIGNVTATIITDVLATRRALSDLFAFYSGGILGGGNEGNIFDNALSALGLGGLVGASNLRARGNAIVQARRDAYFNSPFFGALPSVGIPEDAGGGGGGGGGGNAAIKVEDEIIKRKQERERLQRKLNEGLAEQLALLKAAIIPTTQIKAEVERTVQKVNDIVASTEIYRQNVDDINQKIKESYQDVDRLSISWDEISQTVGGALAGGFTDVFTILTDGSKALQDRLDAVGASVQRTITGLGQALLDAQLLALFTGAAVNPLALGLGLGSIILGGLIGRGERKNPQVNRSITGRPVASPSSQLVASMGIDQIHFALERYKSENFLA